MKKRHVFTEEEERIIRDLFPTNRTKVVAERLGISVSSCYRKAYMMGLKKDEEWKKGLCIELGKSQMSKLKKHQFKKGYASVLSEEALKKMGSTWFKKGNSPHNEKHDGAESVRTDKKGNRYTFVRLSKNKWIPKHIHIWEQANGKVPKGYNIVFKDRNTMNPSLENLEMVSDAELMKRNSYHNNYPPEIQELVHMKCTLTRYINKSKERNGNSN